MATYTKIPFSSSVNGKGIQLNTNGTVTSIHETLSSATTLDEIWIWVDNYDPSDLKVTIYFGDQAYQDSIEKTIRSESGLVLVVPGLVLGNSTTQELVQGFGPNTNTTLIAYGYVNRIT
jgi:hypothetical protein